jgi:formylglycine-generating enzyme required for sulfatase activity
MPRSPRSSTPAAADRPAAWTGKLAGVAVGALLALAPGRAAADGVMLVQAGAFWMGSDTDDPAEAPLHRVYVRDFWIDRHKVTNAEFVRFLNARGARSAEGEDYFDWTTRTSASTVLRAGPPVRMRPIPALRTTRRSK